jgi:hypothetical protein
MSVVNLEGVFMGANVKTSTFEGKEKSALYIDVYQPDSEQTEKMVQIKSDDLALMNTLVKDFSIGSVFGCKASVNAYKNKAYYKLINLA